jgi:large subunit ribosomal protein L30
MAKAVKKKEEAQTVKIKQIKSAIRRPEDQTGTLIGLGLNKLNRTSELKNTPEVQGMIRKVAHLIKIID